MKTQHPVKIEGIQLVRLGDHVFVKVEMGGKWHDVIAERWDSSFSHIVEPDGIRNSKVSP